MGARPRGTPAPTPSARARPWRPGRLRRQLLRRDGRAHHVLQEPGRRHRGLVPTEGYDHMESKSVSGDKFVGLACDEDNQPDQSEERAKAWIAQIKGEGMPL